VTTWPRRGFPPSKMHFLHGGLDSTGSVGRCGRRSGGTTSGVGAKESADWVKSETRRRVHPHCRDSVQGGRGLWGEGVLPSRREEVLRGCEGAPSGEGERRF